jgi:hypothetical protein
MGKMKESRGSDSLGVQGRKHHIILLLLSLMMGSGLINLSGCCYLYPADKPDPCADKACLFGSRCVASVDGHYATCECPESCPNYGDSDDSQPVCGSDGRYYKNRCELDRQACRMGKNITVKYIGKCGKNNINSRAYI